MLLCVTWFSTASAESSVSGEVLMDKAKAYIDEQILRESPNRDYTIEAMSTPNAFHVPDGEITFAIELPYGVRYNAPTNASVSTYLNGRLYEKSLLRFRVHSYEQVMVLNKTLPVNHAVTMDDIRIERIDTARARTGYITDTSKILGMVMRRTVQADKVLTLSMLQKPVIITYMANVNIISNVNSIEVKTLGQALQEGREGQLIRVKNVTTKKVVTAKVIDESTVEVATR